MYIITGYFSFKQFRDISEREFLPQYINVLIKAFT